MNELKIQAAFGRFAIEFEQICNTMESGIRVILVKQGLHNEGIQEILLSGYTAEPLYALYQSLCYEHLNPEKCDSEIIDFIFSSFQKLISKRNDLIHGKWWLVNIGESFRDGEVVITGRKLHKNKRGAATKEFVFCIEDLDELYKEARLVLSNVSKLTNCIAGEYPISKNFTKRGKKDYEAIHESCKK